MQKQQTIDFSKFCGRDEDGDSKAICTLQVAYVEKKLVISKNYLAFEYLQAGELCLCYKEQHSKQEYDSNVTLLLTITEASEG